jgi:hypothetical protein
MMLDSNTTGQAVQEGPENPFHSGAQQLIHCNLALIVLSLSQRYFWLPGGSVSDETRSSPFHVLYWTAIPSGQSPASARS